MKMLSKLKLVAPCLCAKVKVGSKQPSAASQKQRKIAKSEILLATKEIDTAMITDIDNDAVPVETDAGLLSKRKTAKLTYLQRKNKKIIRKGGI